ncbi:MAG: alpha/beta hydrolase [Deltaproteobacteria bacterium]|nr:alpha/beta hydrolase [Deltaproteobacteria bacterium]
MKRRLDALRQAAGAAVVDNFFRSISRVGRLHPRADPRRHEVTVQRDLAYTTSGLPEHRLDVYIPRGSPPFPTVLYLHGGGFRILSKDTHWLMGLAFARQGYLVFNASYRLAPRHPFPAALEDASRALRWVLERGPSLGADPGRLVFAGESAGANLSASLALTTAYERPEAFAREVYATGVTPRAVVASCGMFQVSDPGRLGRRRRLPWWLADRIKEVSLAYLGDPLRAEDLADPVSVLERGERPSRPLAPFFLPVGTRDPLLDDTRRMARALEALEVPCEARYYTGEVHAFHAFVWRENAKRCWEDTFTFLARHVPNP